MKSIWNMLQQLSGMLDTDDLSAWEQNFIRSCINTCGPNKLTGHLSGKQVEKVEDIFNKHFA